MSIQSLMLCCCKVGFHIMMTIQLEEEENDDGDEDNVDQIYDYGWKDHDKGSCTYYAITDGGGTVG